MESVVENPIPNFLPKLGETEIEAPNESVTTGVWKRMLTHSKCRMEECNVLYCIMEAQHLMEV